MKMYYLITFCTMVLAVRFKRDTRIKGLVPNEKLTKRKTNFRNKSFDRKSVNTKFKLRCKII